MKMLPKLQQARTADDSAIVLFNDYYLPGSPGLRDFIRARLASTFSFVDVMRAHPKYYAHLPQSLSDLSLMAKNINPALHKFQQIYPDAVFADVYFVVGKLTSGGTTSSTRILIGSEMYGRDSSAPMDEMDAWHKAVLKDDKNLDAIVVHELMHINQKSHPNRNSLLSAVLTEGGADFLAELVTGKNINSAIFAWADAHDKQLWTEFSAARNESNYSNWLYNGSNIKDRPADLGYWMGYQIAKAYYDHAADKRQAIRDLLELNDLEQILQGSHYGEGKS